MSRQKEISSSLLSWTPHLSLLNPEKEGAGPLLGVGRGPKLPERTDWQPVGEGLLLLLHKYKFYSRSLSPFVFLGGLRAMSALCMSNAISGPPGCMMDGSESASPDSHQSPPQSLRPRPPQVLTPLFSPFSRGPLVRLFIHPANPGSQQPPFSPPHLSPFQRPRFL